MIKIEHLEKKYRSNLVIHDLTWDLPEGRTVLLGPNGAGKSTLMNCIAGVVTPNRGTISIAGFSMRNRRAYFPQLGWMPQHVQPLPGNTCLSQVEYAGWLKGLPRREATEMAHKVIEQVGLAAKSRTSSSSLSGGQLRRLGLAEALMGNPVALVLDEPSVGLDPGQRERFRRILGSLEGVHCLVSTHQVDDIDTLFDTVVVMAGGEFVYQGPVAEFLAIAPAGLDTVHAAEFAYRTFVADED